MDSELTAFRKDSRQNDSLEIGSVSTGVGVTSGRVISHQFANICSEVASIINLLCLTGSIRTKLGDRLRLSVPHLPS